MTKNEKYEHTLQAILDLKHSKMLHFDVFRNLKVTGHESIKGIIGMLSFLNEDYVTIIYADSDRELLKIDIDLFIHATKARYKTLLSYLITLNLLSEYDCTYRFGSHDSVHIITEISYRDCIPKLSNIETAIFNLLDIMKDYRVVIEAIAKGKAVPRDQNEASDAFYKVMCDKNSAIVPSSCRKPLTKVISAFDEPRFRIKRNPQTNEEK